MGYKIDKGFSEPSFGSPQYGGFLSSVKKKVQSSVRAVSTTVKQVTKPVTTVATKVAGTTVGKIVMAPLVTPTAFAAKAATHVLSKTGVKPLVQLNAAVNSVYKSKTVTGLRKTYGVQAAAGVAVGATILTGGGAAAIVASALPASVPLLTGKAAKMSIGQTVGLAAAGVAAGAAVTAGGSIQSDVGQPPVSAPGPSVQSSDAAVTQAAPVMAVQPDGTVAPAKKGSVLGPVAGAGAGFLVGGPIGAAVGAAAGFFLSKKK